MTRPTLQPLHVTFQVALSILRAGIIAQRVDYMVATYPGHNIAAIVIAIIASSGGGMIVDALDIGAGYSKGGGWSLCEPGVWSVRLWHAGADAQPIALLRLTCLDIGEVYTEVGLHLPDLLAQ